MATTVDRLKMIFDASTGSMVAGLKQGSAALDHMSEEANKTDRALNSIEGDVNVDVDIKTREADRDLLRFTQEARLKLVTAMRTDVDIDIDQAQRKLAQMNRTINGLQRNLRQDMDVELDTTLASAKILALTGATLGLGGAFTAIIPPTLGASAAINSINIAALATIATLALLAAGLAAYAAKVAIAAGGLVALSVGTFKLLDAYDSFAKKSARFEKVFGKHADSVEEWADTMDSRLGLGTEQLKTFAAGIGDLLRPMGFGAEATAEMSVEFLDLASAISEFTGEDPTRVINATAAAMTGEREQLKSMGIQISQNAIDTKVASLKKVDAYKDYNDEMLKAKATLEIIKEKSKQAWDEFGKGPTTAGAAVNALKSLWENFKVDMIAGLGKIAEEIVGLFGGDTFGGFTESMDALPEWIEEHRDQIKLFFLQLTTWAADAVEVIKGFALSVSSISLGIMQAIQAAGYAKAWTLRASAASISVSSPEAADALEREADAIERRADGYQGIIDSQKELNRNLETGLGLSDSFIASFKGDAEGLIVAMEMKMELEGKPIKDLKKAMRDMTPEELDTLIKVSSQGTDKASKRIARAARNRRVILRAKAIRLGQAGKSFDDLTKKQRNALIRAKAVKLGITRKEFNALTDEEREAFISVVSDAWETQQDLNDMEKTYYATLNLAKGTGWTPGSVIDPGTWNKPSSDSSSSAGQSLTPQQEGFVVGNTTVILDGYRVASVIAERTSIQHREVWV